MVQADVELYINNFANSSFGISFFNLDGKLIARNNKAREYQRLILGTDYLLGESLLIFTSHKNQELFNSYLHKTFKGETQHNIRKFHCYDGQIKWFSSELNPFYANGKIVGCIIISNDITEHIFNRDYKHTAQEVLQTLPQKICLFNRDGHYLWCNQKDCENQGRLSAQTSKHCIQNLSVDAENPLQMKGLIDTIPPDAVVEFPVYGLNQQAPFESGIMRLNQINSKSFGDVYLSVLDDFSLFSRDENKLVTSHKNIRLTHYIQHHFEMDLFKQKFFLLFQPIIDTTTNTCEGYEALIRWQQNNKKIIPPDVFIPILESNGNITQMTRWLFNECCNLIELHKEHFEDKYLSINISVLDLTDATFLNHLELIHAHKPWIFNKFEFEITETYSLENYALLSERIKFLKKMAIKIAIDDFGTGFSTLEKIVQLPCDRIKIDRNFIQRLPDSKIDLIILKTIKSLAKELNIKITVEGVETYDQMAILYNLKIQTMQGYYFSKPVPFYTFIENKKN